MREEGKKSGRKYERKYERKCDRASVGGSAEGRVGREGRKCGGGGSREEVQKGEEMWEGGVECVGGSIGDSMGKCEREGEELL